VKVLKAGKKKRGESFRGQSDEERIKKKEARAINRIEERRVTFSYFSSSCANEKKKKVFFLTSKLHATRAIITCLARCVRGREGVANVRR